MSVATGSGFYLAVLAAGGHHYCHYQAEDAPDDRGSHALADEPVTTAFAGLFDALPVTLSTAAGDAPAAGVPPIQRALSHALWRDPQQVRQLLEPLAAQALPQPLLDRLADHTGQNPLRLKVGAAGLWSLVPWELLPLPDGRFLADAADVQACPPVGLVHNRARRPVDPETAAMPLYVIDPDSGSRVNPPRLNGKPNPALSQWSERVAKGAGWTNDGTGRPPRVSRQDLSDALRADVPPSRMLFLGHCHSADVTKPAQTGLVLSDPAQPGEEASVCLATPRTADKYRRPLTAGLLASGEGDARGRGHEWWPMPARVALIACASGTDAAQHEPWGLVASMINAGAEYVTGTRWTLPADVLSDGATTELALAVDAAHDAVDPIAELGQWIRAASLAWRENPHDGARNPVVWAALTTYLARRSPSD